jgi:hypothetical protein
MPMDFHVRLCLEGVPIHVSIEAVAKKIIGKSC